MKKYILPFMSIALLMAMASCSSSDDEVAEIKEESKLVPMTFTATQESNAGTRAALNNSNGVNWQSTDEISVFDALGDGHNQRFTLTGNVAEGKFSGTASSEATSFTAVYPYTIGATLASDGIVNGISLPAIQTATADSFDPKAALMMAYTTDKSQLNFKNAVSLVKVTTEFDCKQIVLSSNEEIAGTGTLNYNSDKPSITFTSNQSKTVTLKPATVDGVIAAGTYYIAIRHHESKGFSISFINSDDSKAYTRTSTQSNIFNRSKIKNLGTFKESGTWTSTIDENGNVKASQQVDMGVFTINEINYRLIFTKSNLTEDGIAEKETDYGDYFAWGATMPWYDSLDITSSPWKATWKSDKPGGYKDTNCPSYNNAEYVESGILKMEYDPARKILKGDWQIPTQAIWDKFIKGCTKKWNISKIGYEFVKNGQTLFLPAAGYVEENSFKKVGSNGDYWSGTANGDKEACNLFFNSNDVNASNYYYWKRCGGFSVRPVRLVEVPQ